MNPAVCHFDYVHPYLLQNVTAEPVIFVVEQLVSEGWQVDSDPQPTEMVGATALFRVHAQPGETVRLQWANVKRVRLLCLRFRQATNFRVAPQRQGWLRGWRYTEECQCRVVPLLPSRLFV